VELLGCTEAQLRDIDTDFVKLAARGITIVVASGDSGSNCILNECGSDAFREDMAVTGVIVQNVSTFNHARCCNIASEIETATAWTYSPPPPQCSALLAATKFTGEKLDSVPVSNPSACCTLAAGDKYYPNYAGYTYTLTNTSDGTCIIWRVVNGTEADPSSSSAHVTAPQDGACSIFAAVRALTPAKGKVSGGPAVKLVLPTLWPAWPASSPWVTAVGATRFIDQNSSQPEMAADQFGSGGGFSPLFDAFPDQAAAVNRYLQVSKDLPPNGSFPIGGRATPDVAALGQGYQMVVAGKAATAGGTSASAPTFASLVSLLNEARINAGMAPMGWINPFLYQNADAFTDVTVGSNAIDCQGDRLQYGYSCAEGWDPVTGLGSPIFSKLLSAALASTIQ